MTPRLYERQPQVAEVVMDCSATCNAGAVNAMAAKYPGRALWLNGDLNIDGNIGSALPVTTPENQTLLAAEVPASGPVLLVVTGSARLSGGSFYGVLHSRQANWDFGGGASTVTGALISEGNITNTSAVNQSAVSLDIDVLTRLRTRHGAFVRVPGGWKDF